jgi:uncharacterized protein YprB with RNaseH-like and TPR domain
MLDVEEQLARLRKRIATIDRKYVSGKPAAKRPPSNERIENSFIEEWADGQVVENEFGPHFQTERLFPSCKRHGSADIGTLADLPASHLDRLSGNEIPAADPSRWAFLDTETTGLMGGSGTYAFLIGVGRITPKGFSIRQYFMREYAEERSVLEALCEHLDRFDVLITYNGRSYDQPLLETRYRINRAKPPFANLAHLDLLYGARRIWKLRLPNCRLMQLEQEVLGVYREGDLPGELIPYMYFEYLRRREAQRLVPIFHHNAIDILTLACLTAIVPAAFRETDSAALSRIGLTRGADLLGIGRWLLAASEYEKALELMKGAIAAGLPDALLFRALWDIAQTEKKLARPDGARKTLTELASCRNEYQVRALEELAKFYEHEQKSYGVALELTDEALRLQPSDVLMRRRARLERRLATSRIRRLL